jgi:hypothetical protein
MSPARAPVLAATGQDPAGGPNAKVLAAADPFSQAIDQTKPDAIYDGIVL